MNNFLKQLTVLLHFFPLLYLHMSYAVSYRTNPYNPNTMLFGHELIAVSCADGIKTLVAKKYCHENKKNKSWQATKKRKIINYFFCKEETSKKTRINIELVVLLPEVSGYLED